MNILIADKLDPTAATELTRLGHQTSLQPNLASHELAAALANNQSDILIVRSTRVLADVFENTPHLKLVIRAGAGFDNIDLQSAHSHNVPICNCPGMNAVAVAELTFAHILNCDRRLAEQANQLRAGQWNKAEFSIAKGLKSSTLGVVGLGAIGREVVQRARAFDMSVLGWSPSLTPDTAAELGINYAGPGPEGLLKLASSSDVVTIHIASTPNTQGMIGSDFFSSMRQGATFINTSRGAIIDEPALTKAIQTKALRVGLDVYTNQPSEKKCAWMPDLAKLPNTWGTHHIGASTEQAQSAVALEVVQIIREYAECHKLRNQVPLPQLSNQD